MKTAPRNVRRSRWAAIGAAIAVSLGGGGVFLASAAPSAPSSVITIDPLRILDTRDPVNVGLPGPFVSPVSQKLTVTGPVATTTGTATVVPAGATGVLLNVTAVGSTAEGFISIRPGDATGAPSTSSLNFSVNETAPNSVQVGLPTTGTNAGKIDITYDALGTAGPTTDVLIDVVGYLVPASGGTGPAGPPGAPGAPGADGQTLVYRALSGVPVPSTDNFDLTRPAFASGTDAVLFAPIELVEEGTYLFSSTSQFFDPNEPHAPGEAFGVTKAWVCPIPVPADESLCQPPGTEYSPAIPHDSINGAQVSSSFLIDVPAEGATLVSRTVVRGGVGTYVGGASVIVTRFGD